MSSERTRRWKERFHRDMEADALRRREAGKISAQGKTAGAGVVTGDAPQSAGSVDDHACESSGPARNGKGAKG